MSGTTLPARMRAAASIVAEVNALYSFNTDHGVWSPDRLRHEADVIERETPNGND